MLAFGVEHGDASKRNKIKAGTAVIENQEIVALFKRLRNADILTKAYFMLGGPWETEESALATIDFAIKSGATLAYFALYKDFSGAAKNLRKQSAPGDSSVEAYLNYSQMAIQWDAAFSMEDDFVSINGFNEGLICPSTPEERILYRQLADAGFRFFDVIKYNDFHSTDGSSRELLKKATWSAPDEYFRLVESAFRRFYLRETFVADYEQLLKHGY